MKVLLDTSVLVAAMIEAHPAHEPSLRWLQRIREGLDEGVISVHSLAELYAILTRLPVHPRLSPAIVQQLIKHNVIDVFSVVELAAQDYAQLIEDLSNLGIIGGATYDAVILRAALKANVDQIITLNEKDFQRVNPALAHKIISLG